MTSFEEEPLITEQRPPRCRRQAIGALVVAVAIAACAAVVSTPSEVKFRGALKKLQQLQVAVDGNNDNSGVQAGRDVNINRINSKGESEETGDCEKQLQKYLPYKKEVEEISKCLAFLHQKGYQDELRKLRLGGSGGWTAFELAFYNKNWDAVSQLCNFQMVSRTDSKHCDEAKQKAQDHLHRPKDSGDWFILGFKGGGQPWGRQYSEKDCYLKGLSLDPKSAVAWYNLGVVGGGDVAGKQYSEKECYLKALSLDPKYGDAWNNLGTVGGGEVAGKQYSKKECYLKALSLDPKNAMPWGNLGVWGGGEVAGKWYSKKDCYQVALSLDPKYAYAWGNLGWVGGGEVAGKWYSKKECYQVALSLDGKLALAWRYLGNLGGGEVAGKHFSATECFERAKS